MKENFKIEKFKLGSQIFKTEEEKKKKERKFSKKEKEIFFL